MKKTLAFSETRNNKTALVVFADNLGVYFCVKINHINGNEALHPVVMKLLFANANKEAETFLSEKD